MAVAVAQFFQVIGLDMVPPTNISELIPYLLTLGVGLFLVSAVFRVVAGIGRALLNLRGG